VKKKSITEQKFKLLFFSLLLRILSNQMLRKRNSKPKQTQNQQKLTY